MTIRLKLAFGAGCLMILELAAVANWYQEWKLAGDKAQVWLAYCIVLVSVALVEHLVAHLLLGNICPKLRGVPSDTPATQIDADGKVWYVVCYLREFFCIAYTQNRTGCQGHKKVNMTGLGLQSDKF